MQGFFIALLICSVSMSALALLYMASTPLLTKRYSEKGRYYAWLVIVIGLIVPFRPQWGNAIVKVDIPSEAAMPIIQIGSEAPVTIPIAVPIDNTALSAATFDISWWQIVFAVWLAGMIVFLAYHAIKHYCFVKMARRWSESITNEQTLALFGKLKEEMEITRCIELYLCSSVGSPMMIGFIKPRIYLPTANIEQDELRFILKHELIHHKRKDLLYKYLVLFATAVHWFNPVAYFMAKAIYELCEMSCDTEVVQSTDVDTRQQYSEAIIGIVKFQSKLKTALSTNFYGGKKGMKNRISSIMDTTKKRAGALIVCLTLIFTVGTGFVFAANANIAEATANPNAPMPVYNAENNAAQMANRFDIYKVFGLTYDPDSDELFFNGELVRYFEDLISLPEYFGNVTYGTQHFTENGTVDVHAARDYSVVIQHPNGLTDHSGKLLGLEAYSQEEFDARDIDSLKNLMGMNLVATLPDGAVDVNTDSMPVLPDGLVAIQDDSNNPPIPDGAWPTFEGNTAIGNSNPMPGGTTISEQLAGCEDFGITFDGNIANGGRGNIYYQGQLVRTLIDDTAGRYMTISSNTDHSGNINIRILRNDSGAINGVEVIEV